MTGYLRHLARCALLGPLGAAAVCLVVTVHQFTKDRAAVPAVDAEPEWPPVLRIRGGAIFNDIRECRLGDFDLAKLAAVTKVELQVGPYDELNHAVITCEVAPDVVLPAEFAAAVTRFVESSPHDGAEALREAARAARGMHDPVAPDCAEWADWLDRRAAQLERG